MDAQLNLKPNLKEILQSNNDELHQQFIDGVDIAEILRSRSQLIDRLLQKMWQKHQLDDFENAGQLTLVAVGGYGREEMHPASDVDLLVLLDQEPDADTETKLSDFVQVNRNGKIAMKLDDDDEILNVETCSEFDDVLLTTAMGQCIRFPVTDIRVFAGRN